MPTLGLTPRRAAPPHAPKTLPASVFPDRADAYICDKCGRDITKHLHPGRAHAGRAMGRVRYRCACGSTYLTGAAEWDYLGYRERRDSIRFTMVASAVLSALASIPGFAVYGILYLNGLPGAGKIALGVITAAPFVIIQLFFWPPILASVYRTRIRKG